MKKKVLSLCLALLLAASLITPSFAAFSWPSAYWPLQAEWIEAADPNVNDPDRIIAVTKKTYDLLIPYAPNFSVYGAMESMCGLTSWAYETRGDLDNAILWLERHLEMNRWLTANGLPGNIDLVLNAEARLNYLKAARDVTVYALSDTDPSPYKTGPSTGVWYGMTAGSNEKGSAALFYLDFKYRNEYSAAYWVNYYRNTSDSFSRALDGGVIECAFNFESSELRDVLAADQYINETLATLGGLNATILLRIGAEVTGWDPRGFDADLYIQAFRKVAAAARKYPNLQTVYSPEIIRNRLVTEETYYPGDEYVDWVGVSAYHKSCYRNSSGVLPGAYDMDYRLRGSYGNDAWFGVGFYDYDPVVALKSVADLANAHNKPMMISECGFPNMATKYNGDTSAFSADQLNKFYSYLTMVYPQIKAVFYFDVDRTALEGYDFSISDKPALANLYYSAIEDAGVYLEDPDGSVSAMWEPLNQTKLSGSTPKLRLATYVSFPNVADAEVKYYVDGALVGTANKAPYYYDLDTAKLSVGSHTVKVTAAGGQFSREVSYTLTVPNRIAYANTQTVRVDNKSVTFETYKLKDANGNDTNYIKVRDLALAVNGTAAQFEVDWDGVVNLRTGRAYTVRGVENQTPFSGDRAYKLPEEPTNVNGSASDLQAFILTDDNGGDYTYYKLRDLGKALGFNVGYSDDVGVFIQTDKPYTDAD